jgi:hypothetical protein
VCSGNPFLFFVVGLSQRQRIKKIGTESGNAVGKNARSVALMPHTNPSPKERGSFKKV